MGAINTLPIQTRKTSEFGLASELSGQIIVWSGVGGSNLQRITIDDVANQLLTHTESAVEILGADKAIATGQEFFQLLDAGGTDRNITAVAGVSAFINNAGSANNLLVGSETLLPGESAYLIYNGTDHTVVKLASASGGTSFLEVTLTDVVNATAYYYGGLTAGGDWQINKILRSDLASKTVATEQNNAAVTTLESAWTARTTLTYR
ncbi:MAG: hypothetical protein ACTHK7_12165 [Aureliella sp.]